MNSLPSKWICRSNNEASRELLKKTGYSAILLELLAKRGVIEEKDVSLFLNPSLGNLHNPMKLPGIREGIKRVKEAIEKKEKILIFGDYDADGVISASLMYKFLKDLGLEADVYIPDRFNEGYDLSINFFRKISNECKYDLVISVDCGTNSVKVQKFVMDNKTPDVIVCDHHNQTAELDTESHRYIVINPGLKNSAYPFRYLSGAAVTFKFITGVLRELDDERKKKFEKGYLTEMLDLVAISTIADIMPLIDENRIIVKRGLAVLKKTVNPGLKKMIGTLMQDKKYLDEHDIGFIIAPRLNASGRVKNARSSFELLTEDDGDIVDRIVDELNCFNKERQEIQKNIFDEIVENNDFEKIVAEKRIFIDRSENWNEGVLGVVASNIVREFNIPAILFKETKGKLKGSGRSIDKFDLHGNLVLCSDLFESFGGHRLACGITMDVSNYETFCDNFMKIACENLKIQDVKKKFIFDMEINFNDIAGGIIREINLLKPFGCGNPEPCFVTTNCTIDDFSFLSDEKHIRLKLKQGGITMDAIMFGVDDKAKNKIMKNKKINILYKIKENNRGNFSAVQLVILDLF